MRTIIFLAALLLAVPGFAQNATVDRLFDKYKDKEGFTFVYITNHMFELFAEFDSEEDENDFIEVTKNLEGIKILNASDSLTKVDFYKSIMGELSQSDYKDLMIVHKKDHDIKFMIKEKVKGKITEFLMVAGGATGNTIISIYGDIDLRRIKKLSRSMKINGLDQLDNMEKEEKK